MFDVDDVSGTGVALVAGGELGTEVAFAEGGALVAGGKFVAAVGCDACPVAESVVDVDVAESEFVDDVAGLGGAFVVVDEVSLVAPDEEEEVEVVSAEVD